ncbi:hypothetical protein RND71_022474 [Anisodus tanguticus]|uniref:Uncharacterized protein n=1 Tax=Anisodus tanguticus TaxID=243964 RepID=A0AAE1RQR8_9SOLA|nr:hypothetical protein RND71_022474 [Anisodus tanguticus]
MKFTLPDPKRKRRKKKIVWCTFCEAPSCTSDVALVNFLLRSRNVARAVGKGEVKRIYKCIQRTSEYISAYMDGLIEVPALKYHLFGHAAPFEEGSQTRNIKEDGNIITLLCREIKNKEDLSKEGQKGSQLATPSEPISTNENGLLKIGKD